MNAKISSKVTCTLFNKKIKKNNFGYLGKGMGLAFKKLKKKKLKKFQK